MKSFFLLFFILFTTTAHADALTHAIGNTGYMIREAMCAKAYKFDKENYRHAVKLQREAKNNLRGLAKKGRNTTKAMELTQEAYQIAKSSRDVALTVQGLRVAQ